MLLFSISRAEKCLVFFFFQNTAVYGCRDAEMIMFFLAFQKEGRGGKLFISHLVSLLLQIFKKLLGLSPSNISLNDNYSQRHLDYMGCKRF